MPYTPTLDFPGGPNYGGGGGGGGGWTNNTTGGSTGYGGGTVPGGNTITDEQMWAWSQQQWAAEMAMQQAAQAAQQAYQQAMLQYQDKALAQQAAQQAAQLALQQAMALGFINGQPTLDWSQMTGYYQMPGAGGAGGGAATSPEMAIWQNRPDLKAFYDQNWGAGKYNPEDAVKNWLSMTGEQGVTAANRDAVAYAQGQGWYNPQAAQGGAQQGQGQQGWQKTWQREAGEAGLGLQYIQYLNSLKGPENWVQYWQTQQNARGTSLPDWAATLGQVTGIQPQGMQGRQLQAALGQGQQGLQRPTAPGTQAQALGGTQQGWGPPQANILYGGAAPGQMQPTDKTPWQMPQGQGTQQGQGTTQTQGAAPGQPKWWSWSNPNQVNWQQFTQVAPSERAGLQGLVEASGGWWPDYLDRINRQRPRGNAGGSAYYGW